MPGYDHNFTEACNFLFQLEDWLTTGTGSINTFGITKAMHPEYYEQIVNATTEEEKREIARECYYLKYWEPVALLTGYVPQNGKIEENPLVTFQKVSFIQYVGIHHDTITAIIKAAKEEITKKADFILWKSLSKYFELQKEPRHKAHFPGWVNRILQIAERYHIAGQG